jgi:hypothetical protein
MTAAPYYVTTRRKVPEPTAEEAVAREMVRWGRE